MLLLEKAPTLPALGTATVLGLTLLAGTGCGSGSAQPNVDPSVSVSQLPVQPNFDRAGAATVTWVKNSRTL